MFVEQTLRCPATGEPLRRDGDALVSAAGRHYPIVGGVPCGVFTWRAPVPLVEELSELLAGRAVAA